MFAGVQIVATSCCDSKGLSQFNELVDRNVMTIDAFDWAHRTGADPADEPTADLCTSRPTKPRQYEGTFAHEWQHLVEYYSDPNEVTWMNEGLSDFGAIHGGFLAERSDVGHAGLLALHASRKFT